MGGGMGGYAGMGWWEYGASGGWGWRLGVEVGIERGSGSLLNEDCGRRRGLIVFTAYGVITTFPDRTQRSSPPPSCLLFSSLSHGFPFSDTTAASSPSSQFLRLLHSSTQRPLLHHHGHDFIQHIRRRHGRVLGVGIICRRHLHDVRRDEVDALEPAQDGAQLAGRPAAGFGRAGCGGDFDVVSGDSRSRAQEARK